jgi:hypothetical protein
MAGHSDLIPGYKPKILTNLPVRTYGSALKPNSASPRKP